MSFFSRFVVFSTTACLFIFGMQSCNKGVDAPKEGIQQGENIISVNALYGGMGSSRSLMIRYNNVINAPISGTVALYLTNGETKFVPIAITAGYQKLQSWSANNYLNIWNYQEDFDSTLHPAPQHPVIDGDWQIDSIKIVSLSCSDKQYGFKVLTGADNWVDFYHPKDPMTQIHFLVNKVSVDFTGYDFEAGGPNYYSTEAYTFRYFDAQFQAFSAKVSYPFKEKMTIDLPSILYRWKGINYGSQPDGPEAATNYSTLKLEITKLHDNLFDGVFSGKVYSSKQADTLFISEGFINNSVLPTVTQF